MALTYEQKQKKKMIRGISGQYTTTITDDYLPIE